MNDVAFIRGCCSFARRLQRRQRLVQSRSPVVASNLLFKTTSRYQCRKSLAHVETDNCLPDRRSFIVLSAFGATLVTCADAALGFNISMGDKRQYDGTVADLPISITLPLEPASGGTYCVRLTMYPSSDVSDCTVLGDGLHHNLEDSFRLYRAIVDTGSPYLVLPSSSSMDDKKRPPKWISNAFVCSQKMNESIWLANSDYGPTEEIYGAVKGEVRWKLARYAFRDPLLHTKSNSDGESQSLIHPPSYTTDAFGVVGVLDDALTNEATGGGMIESYALLGLIRNNNPNADRNRFPEPRPSFLEQESLFTSMRDHNEYQIKSFCINGPRREIKFSTQAMISAAESALQLVDLRPYGDFVDHYAVVVESLTLDDVTVTSKRLNRPIVAVFDSGLTGCLLIRQFWDMIQNCITADNASKIRSLSLSLVKTEAGNVRSDYSSACKMMSSIEDDPRFYVDPIVVDWFDNDKCAPYVIILGQTFLRQGALTIDIDDRRASFILERSS